MRALARSAARSILVLAAAATAVLLLASCGPRLSHPAAGLIPPPLPQSTDATAVAHYYLGGSGVDVALKPAGGHGDSPFAYWRAAVQATPRAEGAAQTLAFMGRRYAGSGRPLVLRIGNSFGKPPTAGWVGKVIFLVWNPTEETVATGQTRSALPPHSLDVSGYFAHDFGDDLLGPVDTVDSSIIITNVTTDTLSGDSLSHERFLGSIRTLTGLK